MRPLVSAPEDPRGVPKGWIVVGGPVDFSFSTGSDGDLEITGSGSAPRNAFLASDRSYGDFLVEFDVMIDRGGGNSGFQIRSAVDADRMVGYQIEIDPSERSWSTGLYDEGRRGWLASLADNVTARDAFVPGKWNTVRILAVGPRIRTWINDVPAIDHLDFVDRDGRFGFQVHSGRCDVRWRRIRIADLGIRRSVSMLEDDPPGGLDLEDVVRSEDGSLRFDRNGRGSVVAKIPVPDVPLMLDLDVIMPKGLMIIRLGDMSRGPGYGIRVPGPVGDGDRPGSIRILRGTDRMRVLIDGVPLIPGPPDLDGPLSLRIDTVAGTIASIPRMEMDLPSETEIEAVERHRSMFVTESGEETSD